MQSWGDMLGGRWAGPTMKPLPQAAGFGEAHESGSRADTGQISVYPDCPPCVRETGTGRARLGLPEGPRLLGNSARSVLEAPTWSWSPGR